MDEFDAVYESMFRKLRDFAVAKGLGYHDAEDLAQEVAIKVMHKDPNMSLAYAAARNKLVDPWRSRKPDAYLEDIASPLTVEADFIRQQESEHLEQLISGFPPVYQNVVRAYMEGVSYDDMRALPGLEHMSAGSLRIAFYRAKSRLRRAFHNI